MGGLRAAPVAVVAAIAAVVAMLLPWAHYGGIEVRVFDIPGWPLYVAAVVAQQLCVIASILSSGRRAAALALGLLLGAATAVVAIALMVASQDPSTVFGQVVPPIAPGLWSGGPVSLAAAALSTYASILATRPAAPAGADDQ